ncbi:MAG: transposase [Chloracidobacterium sp.]|nr:transposase [Chloracidobacterium sp.]
MQNGYVERFNRTYRQAILDMYIFESLDQVRELTAKWIDFYNRRGRDALGGSLPEHL